jgi:hypothetical protein
MSNRGTVISVAIIILVLALGIYAYKHTAASQAATLADFSAVRPNFVAHGANLNNVEVWGIPTGTGISENDYMKIGDMSRQGDAGDNETWTMPIPIAPLLVTQIFAEGYGQNGADAGKIFLPYAGATELYDALWGNSATSSPVLQRSSNIY